VESYDTRSLPRQLVNVTIPREQLDDVMTVLLLPEDVEVRSWR